MSIPTNPVDKNLPKGANFLAVVIGFAVVILLALLVAWFMIGRGGKKVFPVNTKTTPSQTRVIPPSELERPQVGAPVVLATAA